MEPLSTDKVEGLVTMFQLNYDTESPFKGLIDMGFIFGIPIPHQNQVWEAIPQKIKDEMEKVSKEASGS
tara:strand:- start:15787 stop:15993 length:207 start_codon:yes stop_codon:yes gene_type:complete